MNGKQKNITLLWCTIGMLLVGLPGFSQDAHVWTSSNGGRQFTGVLVGVEGKTISIRRASDDAVFQVTKADLIPADWEWIVQSSAKPASAGPVEDLSELIAEIPASTGTPAIGVLLVKDGKTRGLGVFGLRKAGDTTVVEIDDKWHLGSCTKSMTATLAATFVEEGILTWASTLSEILGKEVKMRKEYESVTLGMLLANRSGISGNLPDSVYDSIRITASVGDLKDRDLLKQRAQYVEAVLNFEPSSTPGSQNEYSNSGFVVAGAMLEQVSGKPWERLIEERIFSPLGMNNAGFGNAAREDKSKPRQPWPHTNPTTPFAPGGGDDNPWVIGPAGTVHCSLSDIARYIGMHAAREIGPVLKKSETYKFLHTAVPDNNDYARGWIVAATGWSNGPAISHDGSNTMNYCSFWIAPERGAAVAAFTNCGEAGSETCRAAIQLVVDMYLK